MIRFVILLSAVLGVSDILAAPPLEIPGTLLTAIEDVKVPAQEAGVLSAVHVREGQTVKRGDALAQIADAEARLVLDRTRVELEMARKKSDNDVNIRFARKSAEVAKAELQRALESRQIYAKSVSDSETDRLRLVAQRAELEIEQATYEREMAQLLCRTKQNEIAAAEEQLRRRQIVAPLDGTVVDVYHGSGEWVEAGQPVVRVMLLDRLRAEGFLAAHLVSDRLPGAAVRLVVDGPEQPGAEYAGKIVFVGPEINPVNSQVRVWAEVENRELKLRPGMRAKLIVAPPPAEEKPAAAPK